jgi:hypothetical protein
VNRRGPASLVVPWLLAAAWWTGTAWLGRQATPWAIQLTTPAFLVGLAVAYVAAWTVPLRWHPSGRAVIFRAAAVTMALVVCVVVLELPALAGKVDYRRLRSSLMGGLTDALNERWQGPAEEFVEDPELSFRHTPNTRWSGTPLSDMSEYVNRPLRLPYQTFSTDRRGFRNRSDRDRADIALIGDSYVEGFHVSDDETAAVRVEQLTGRTTENLAVSGYGSLQELLVLQKYAVPLAPRMVAWFFFEGNDLDDDQSFENAMASRGPPGASAEAAPVSSRRGDIADRSFTINAVRQLRSMADWIVPNGSGTFGWFRERNGIERRMYFYDFYATREFGDFERARFETTKRTFQRGAEICRQHGIRLVVFYVPIKFRVYGDLCAFPPSSPCARWHPWDLETRFASFCRDANIEFVSLTVSMRQEAGTGRLLYLPEDSHWNAEGHAFVARRVADVWMLSAAARKPDRSVAATPSRDTSESLCGRDQAGSQSCMEAPGNHSPSG